MREAAGSGARDWGLEDRTEMGSGLTGAPEADTTLDAHGTSAFRLRRRLRRDSPKRPSGAKAVD